MLAIYIVMLKPVQVRPGREASSEERAIVRSIFPQTPIGNIDAPCDSELIEDGFVWRFPLRTWWAKQRLFKTDSTKSANRGDEQITAAKWLDLNACKLQGVAFAIPIVLSDTKDVIVVFLPVDAIRFLPTFVTNGDQPMSTYDLRFHFSQLLAKRRVFHVFDSRRRGYFPYDADAVRNILLEKTGNRPLLDP